MTFTTRNLTNDHVVVSGTDVDGNSGKVVLDASQWVSLNKRDDVSQAQAAFEAAVEEFFKPLTDAAERASQTVSTVDEDSFIVLHEGVEGVAGRPADILRLNHDSIVLRIIEQGNQDRLVWVRDVLEVLEVLPVSTKPARNMAATTVGYCGTLGIMTATRSPLTSPRPCR